MLDECERLDKDVVVREQFLAVRKEPLEVPLRFGMSQISPIGQSIDRGRIEKDHRVFLLSVFASASSWRSETGASLFWSDRPAPTNGKSSTFLGGRLRFPGRFPSESSKASRMTEARDVPRS